MFQIVSCGYNSQHPKPCNIEHKNGLPEYLLLLVKTDSWFIFDNNKCHVPLNTVVLFEPYTYIKYGCTLPGYNDDWIHFKTDDDGDKVLIDQLHISLNNPLYPAQIQSISHYVQLLTNVFHSDLLLQEQIEDSLLRALLFTLASELKKAEDPLFCHKYYASISKKRTEIYNNPSVSWSVAAIARTLGISVSYFQHLYKLFFGCSLQKDIIKSRLELSKFYLLNSNMTIQAIADFCGYENEIHFMRQFKKYEGVTPTTFRNHT